MFYQTPNVTINLDLVIYFHVQRNKIYFVLHKSQDLSIEYENEDAAKTAYKEMTHMLYAADLLFTNEQTGEEDGK